MAADAGKGGATVLTTVRNGMPFLGEVITSVRAQKDADFRHLVVDDGSSDGTAAFLKQEAGQGLEVISSPPVGRGRALNLGLQHCATEFVAILDADDTASPGWLAAMLGVMAEHPEIAVLSCTGMLDRADMDIGAGAGVKAYRLSPEMLLYRNPVHHSGTLIRTAALREAGGYDESRDCLFDYELWVRLMQYGKQIWRVDNGFIFKRIHAGQHFERRNRLHYLLEGYRIRRRVSQSLLGGKGAWAPAAIFIYGLLPRVLRNWVYGRNSRDIYMESGQN